jgi:RNA polymerase sigma-70 factor (ECF subfamily)
MNTTKVTRAELLLGDGGWLRRLARDLTKGAQEADELFHETVAAAACADAAPIAALRPFAAGIARRKSARLRRDAGRRARREESAARIEALPSTLDLVAEGELQRKVAAAVDALHEPYRSAILLRFWEDRKPGAIAQATGAPVETVRVRIRRGIELLRSRLDADFGGRALWVAPLTRIRRRETAYAAAGAGHAPWLAGVAAVCAAAFAAVGFLRVEVAPPAAGSFEGTRADRRLAVPATVPDEGGAAAPARTTVVAAAAGPEPAAAVGRTPGGSMLRRADEVQAFDALELIAAAQRDFAAGRWIDADADGIGEHGYLAELMGEPRRGDSPVGTVRHPNGAPAQFFDPHRLRLRFSRVAEGVARADGYLFRMVLPGVDGTPLVEADQGGSGPLLPDADRAERDWCCYAWPEADAGGAVGRVFYVDRSGSVLVADNARAAYLGPLGAPAPSAALSVDSGGRLGGPSAAEGRDGRGLDGEAWRVAVLPAASTMVVEVVGADGGPVRDLVVAVLPPAGAGDPDHEACEVQRLMLGAALLPASGPPEGPQHRTDDTGRVTIHGRPVEGAVVRVRTGRLWFVPTQVRAAPGLLRIELPPESRQFATAANESAAIATLKNISSAQAQCQASGVIDANGNGAGEYGYLAELAGACYLRGADGPTDQRMSPPVLSAAFGAVSDLTRSLPARIVVRSGYCFQVFLCDAGSRGLAESALGGAGPQRPDPALAEVVWCCYAWPMEHGVSGTRAFFVNQAGDVFACENQTAVYAGVHNGPRPDAIFPPDSGGRLTARLASPAVGADRERWVVVN